VEPLPLLLREMLLFLLGKLRRLLQAVDVWITRRAFAHPYFCPPANDRRREEWKTFFRQLDAGHAGGRTYLELHLERLVSTMMIVPPPGQTGRALELGCYMQMTPALALQLGYREVRGAYLGPAGKTENKIATIRGREVFRCDVDLFDAERDRFPYPDNHFDCVLACEIIEHLARDPMHMLVEIRRVLIDGGALVLTTPNCASLGSVTRALHGYQSPQIFACYPHPDKAAGDGPHIREYTPFELNQTLTAAGFRTEVLFTDRIGARGEGTWTLDLLQRHGFDTRLRGEQIYCRARKDARLPVDRFPDFLYER